MSKVKMRCTVCGKWFQSANAKEVTCPDCVQKARKEKLAAKSSPQLTNKTAGATNVTASNVTRAPAPPAKPKQHVQSGTNQWLDSLEDVKISEPEPFTSRSKAPPVPHNPRTGQNQFRTPGDLGNPGQNQGASGNQGGAKPYAYRRDDNERGSAYNRDGHDSRGPSSYRPGGIGSPASSFGQRPRAPQDGKPGYGGKPAYSGGPRGKNKPHAAKPPTPPKPPREKIPPPPPFVPTPEQIKQVEERYLELAQPAEFDGIRTQIAHELHIPKKAIKKIVKNIRTEAHIPSWWELQTYKGSNEELDRIKVVYEPYLPLPQVGVHKIIAEKLSIKPNVAYQAIKAIRQELGLPQYNDPTLHAEELAEIASRRSAKKTSSESEPVSTPPEEEIVALVSEPETEVASPVTEPEPEAAQVSSTSETTNTSSES